MAQNISVEVKPKGFINKLASYESILYQGQGDMLESSADKRIENTSDERQLARKAE